MNHVKLISKLKNYIITDINYRFEEAVFGKLAKQIDNLGEIEVSGNIQDKYTVKVGVHNDLKEYFILMDTKVIEKLDTSILPKEFSEEMIIRTIDISVRFNFDIISSDNFNESDEKMKKKTIDNLHEEIKKKVVDICSYQVVNIISNITSLDDNQKIKLDYPVLNFELDFYE